MSHILIDHLTQAASSYRDQLHATHHAAAYLKARSLHDDIVARHGLSYASAGLQALHEAFPGYNDRASEKIRLVAANDGGHRYDRFHDWTMFPILDDVGSATGFDGRVLEGDGPKYLNSLEAEVFQKGRVLFGLTQTVKAIAAADTAYVVEEYLDAASLAQHDVRNAATTLGTATTGRYVERLLGLAKRMIFCFGGDDAGRRTVVRTLGACLPHVTDATDVSSLFLPCDHDPDSYMHAKGGGVFNDLALEASSPEGFFLASVIQDHQLECAESRVRLAATTVPRFQRINTPAMLCRILTAIAGPSRSSVDELVDLCGSEKNMFSAIDH